MSAVGEDTDGEYTSSCSTFRVNDLSAPASLPARSVDGLTESITVLLSCTAVASEPLLLSLALELDTGLRRVDETNAASVIGSPSMSALLAEFDEAGVYIGCGVFGVSGGVVR